MNHKQVESSIQVSDLLDLVKQINFFPEASALMMNLVKSVDACLDDFICILYNIHEVTGKRDGNLTSSNFFLLSFYGIKCN